MNRPPSIFIEEGPLFSGGVDQHVIRDELAAANYRKILANFWRTLVTLGLMTTWQYMLPGLFW